jgi:hypothetical protein
MSLHSSYQSRRGHIHLSRVLPLVGCQSKTPTEAMSPMPPSTTSPRRSQSYGAPCTPTRRRHCCEDKHAVDASKSATPTPPTPRLLSAPRCHPANKLKTGELWTPLDVALAAGNVLPMTPPRHGGRPQSSPCLAAASDEPSQ